MSVINKQIHKYLFLCGIAFRICYLLLSATYNQKFPKITTIDYNVFTDAARYVIKGESPYKRETYRYSPIIAFINIPNIIISPLFGKLLYSMADILLAVILKKMITSYESNAEKWILIDFFWMLNPFVITTSPRGSLDSIIGCIILGAVYFLENGRVFVSGLLLGLAAHIRIYPIIYLPIICLNLYGTQKHLKGITKNLFSFLFAFSFSFLVLLSVFWTLFGFEFIENSYLYHFHRIDIRNNYSIYFYANYLLDNSNIIRIFVKLPFIIQSVIILAVAIVMNKKLHKGMFLTTFSFVFLNKVYLAQYFTWWAIFLPLIFRQRDLSYKWLIRFCVWFGSVLNCCYWTNQLEAKGNFVFDILWLSVSFMFCANCFIFVSFVDMFSKKVKQA